MHETDRSRLDSLLELLTDEVERRLRVRASTDAQKAPAPGDGPTPPQPVLPAVMPGAWPVERTAAQEPQPPEPCPDEPEPVMALGLPVEDVDSAPAISDWDEDGAPDEAATDSVTGSETYPAMAQVSDLSSHTVRFLSRLTLGLLVVIVLINIPFNRHGTALARAIPGSASLVIRNGLLIKEIGKPDVYMFLNDTFRWISSLDAFEHYGYRWQDVHEVEAGFLDRFEMGAPIHVLVKCESSPHIYRLEGGVRRWIVDIATFEAEGHRWDDVVMRSCAHIRNIPMGETIPPGRGPAPEP